jgi:two-component system NtrC family response regulator
MLNIMKTVDKVANTSVAVLILGETGTGKGELVKAIHEYSERRDKQLVTINCTSIPESLLESELFGHEKGAFTGAVSKKIGKIEYASGGTLFLDEIGDMPLPLQAKILHVLQDKKIVRLGGNEEIPVDIRVVCATHQNLKEGIELGSFREDLFYRISEIVVELPPLRERGQDISLLARSFLHRYAQQQNRNVNGFTKEAARAIQNYNWPGNIRELENRVKRAVVMADSSMLNVLDLELEGLSDSYAPTLLRDVRARAETEAITLALMNSKTISEAASSLGITRPTLYNLISKYELETHLAGKQEQASES